MFSGCSSTVVNAAQQSSPAAPSANTWLSCNSNAKADALGINVDNLNVKELGNANLVAELEQSGAAWTRITMYWGWMERKPGVIDWSGIDTALAALQQAHITALVTLDGPVPCWALGEPNTCAPGGAKYAVPPADLWAQFVSTAVNRYKSKFHYWEVWNEPDLHMYLPVSDPTERLTQYRDEILVPAVQAIRQADPAATVVGPTLAGISAGKTTPGPQLEQALQLVLNVPSSAMVDVISLHSYYPYHWTDKMQSVEAALTSLGISSKPIWVTEDGLDTSKLPAGTNTEQAVANFFSQEMSIPATGTTPEKIIWFAATDTPNSSGASRDDFGLVNTQSYSTFAWTPRKAYTAMQSLVSQNCASQ